MTTISVITSFSLPMYTDVTPEGLSSNQLNPLHREFSWNISSEAAPCNLTFTLLVMRVSPPGLNLSIPMVESGHIAELSYDPGIYKFIVISMSGAEQVQSNSEEFIIVNSKMNEVIDIDDLLMPILSKCRATCSLRYN